MSEEDYVVCPKCGKKAGLLIPLGVHDGWLITDVVCKNCGYKWKLYEYLEDDDDDELDDDDY